MMALRGNVTASANAALGNDDGRIAAQPAIARIASRLVTGE